MERLAAHVGRRLAGNAERQQHLAFQRALADGVVAVIGQPDRAVRGHEHAVRARENPLAPGTQEIAVAVEHDHRMLAAIEHVDIVVAVDADRADFLERPAGWQLRPVLDRLVGVVAAAHCHHLPPPLASINRRRLSRTQTARQCHSVAHSAARRSSASRKRLRRASHSTAPTRLNASRTVMSLRGTGWI